MGGAQGDRELQALYQAAVETSPDGIWVVDLQGRTLYANPQIARIHRVAPHQLSTLTVFDTLDEQGRQQFPARLAEVASGSPDESDVEVYWVRSDGTATWMLASETVLADADGEAYALLLRFTDYSDRRQILQALRESEDALSDQVAQNDLLQAVTSAANRARTLGDVLVHARDLVLVHDDWTRARAFVPIDGSLVSFDDDPPVGDDLERAQEEAVQASELALARRCFEARALQWDERRLTMAFPVLCGSAPEAEQVHAVIVITSDPPLFRFALIESMASRVAEQLAQVIRRQEAEAALSGARDDAMAASQQKSEFLATMSHEIRTPLNGVIGLNDLLLHSDLDAEQLRLASGAQVAGRALLDVINDILDFSKIEAGRLDLERVDFAVRPVLDQVTGLLTETARAKGVDLTLSCEPEVPASLCGDPTRLAQVVANLVSNAVKFTEHGRVSVTAAVGSGPAGAPVEADRVHLIIEVRDTGIGIAADRVPGLFDPFTQADASTTRRFGGTGLGLAICREIVTAMDGHIEYAANPSGGSLFRVAVVLDAAGRPDQAPELGEHDQIHGSQESSGQQPGAEDADEVAREVLRGRRVLLIDEGRDQVFADQLAYWDLDVVAVPSVRSATQRLAAPGPREFDLVVAAFDTSERHAIQLARRLRTTDGAADLPLLTVASQSGARGSASGDRDEVLVRPVLPSVLRSALLRIVGVGSDSTAATATRVQPAKGRILVVEDHPINQMVAEGLLRLLGYRPEMVDDGVAGVAAAAAGGFDAVLMDVQMPILDGYAATGQIRAAEGSGPRVPIIAMTAAAIEGERERCLAAGMDDYLTKPIDTARLEACLRRWTDPARRADGTTVEPVLTMPASSPEQPQAYAVLDVDRLNELRELDRPAASYVDRAIGNFTAASLRDIPVLQDALAAGDLVRLGSVAHRLAGVALNLGAHAAGELLRSLEDRVRSGDVTNLTSAVLQADLELARARDAMQDYLHQHPSTSQASA